MTQPTFQSASPYQKDILALPATDIDTASTWYCQHFGITEVERTQSPVPSVILERDGSQRGFAINGGDPSQDGPTILIPHIAQLEEELDAKGTPLGNWRIDDCDGQKHQVFSVVAPDGLCYYFHEPLAES